ncbi:TetR/AcrR family transcriptional regulator [Streptomyces profundus]|uniref:TetR/AcrR family transcriptional regulator n=1 Tax=Streptomyces profundus TaxID=2867410 RepID=UPI001D162470|nr:TetR/AcrR family transcriptional regulator [Streptomyces sp. MA3_2.13]UED88053.1 TetR/AcrR family transcriptional regulator [Streptomyces sp. MA3_2.13]
MYETREGQPTTPRSMGRPRNRHADTAILQATVTLLGESGFQGLTMDQVAQRAGVGRATVYRRWRSKEEMIISALDTLMADFDVKVTGDLHEDLFALTCWLRDGLLNAPEGRLLPHLAAQAVSNPNFPSSHMDTWVCPWRDAVEAVLTRGVQEGLVRQDVNLISIVDMLGGVVILRLFLGHGRPLADDQIQDMIDAVLGGALVRGAESA